MSKKRIAVAVLVALLCLGAGRRYRLVNGVNVALESPIPASEIIQVFSVRCWQGVRQGTTKPCTVFTGTMRSRLPTNQYDVLITLEMWEMFPGKPWREKNVEAVIEHPEPGKRIRFAAVGPAWQTERGKRDGPPAYMIRTLFRHHPK